MASGESLDTQGREIGGFQARFSLVGYSYHFWKPIMLTCALFKRFMHNLLALNMMELSKLDMSVTIARSVIVSFFYEPTI